MAAWCGTFAGEDTWLHWTVNPCILESVSVSLLICIAALVLSFQCRRISLLRKRNYSGSERIPGLVAAFYLGIVSIAASHGALLLATVVFYLRGAAQNPYELFNQSASFAAWVSAVVSPHSPFCFYGLGHLDCCRVNSSALLVQDTGIATN